MHITAKSRFSGFAHAGSIAVALVVAATSAGTATAATVTVSSTCTFAKAVKTINLAANQSPCTHSGTFGNSDTVVVPTGSFNISSVVNVTRSMTIHGLDKYATVLQATLPSLSYAIHVTNSSAVVKIDHLTLAGVGGQTVGIGVAGFNDANLNDNNLELRYVVITDFGDVDGGNGGTGGGIWLMGARALLENSLVYLNGGALGGGVSMSIASNSNGTTAVPTFVCRQSGISINSASSGGGIYSNGGKLELRTCWMQQNAAVDGAAIRIDASFAPSVSCNVMRDTPTADPSEFDSNTAHEGLPSIYNGATTCTFNDSIASGNSFPYCGAAAVPCPQQ